MASWSSSSRHAPFSVWDSRPSKREIQQDRRMAELEKKLQSLLKDATSQSRSPSSKKERTNSGACPEVSTPDTVWVCSFCNCPHHNPKKVVCRWCGKKRVLASDTNNAGSRSSAAPAASIPVSTAFPPVILPATSPGPIDKPWMKKILSGGLLTQSSTAAEATASSPSPVDPSCDKRQQLEKLLADARASGCGEDLLKLLQKELEALPAPQVGGQLQETGRLYQVKAKQEKHHSSQIAALDEQFENLNKQRQQLDELEKQLCEQRKQLEAQHALNMERIDAAINTRVSANPGAVLGSLSSFSPGAVHASQAHAAPLVSQATTAQVLSATLGTAVNDPSLFCSHPPEHQAAIKQFCAQVTSHFATDRPLLSSSVSDAPMSEAGISGIAAEVSCPDDLNPHNFVGHFA